VAAAAADTAIVLP